ncbi:MAG: STAS domain-containing protein [Planctomycetota bacterium]|jgi:anti-sigma B factor antagonist
MWNPFSRQTPPPSQEPDPSKPGAAPDEPAAAPAPPTIRRNPIAELELMGSTAVATLTVTQLSIDEGVEQLMELLEDMAELGAQHYVLDIQNVQQMDSACLGCLVEALNKMAATGGRIALANTDPNVKYLFRLTRLDRVFPICHDVMAAIEKVERGDEEEAA